MVEEKKDDEPPFDGSKKRQGTITDKSGAQHSPKSRAKDAAQQGMRKAMSKQELSEVADYIMSFYDRERGTFPKGPTAVMQSVEKKFGETAGQAAEKMIERMAPQQDAEMIDADQEVDEDMNAIMANAGREKHGEKYMDAARDKAQELGRPLKPEEKDKLRDKHSKNRKDESRTDNDLSAITKLAGL
jgi:hypothetical protein